MKYKNKFTKKRPIIKAIIIFNFTFDICEISLTQKLIKLKENITKICHLSYLIKVSILKNIGQTLNGKKMYHIPCISPTYHNKFISEIKANCELFNLYFVKHCTPLVNNRQL